MHRQRGEEAKRRSSEVPEDSATSQLRNSAIIHIINHTHWDREWFLSSVYTTHWIPGLIDRLIEISAENPLFRYLLDGQTLIIEDLLEAYPDYRPKVEQLIANGNLTIGPYYCQPDWKLTSGELLIRNLEYGQKDAAQFGEVIPTGWMVDTFGHLSQSPQIHQQAGIDSIYVWRGVPQLEPYINWRGADGTEIFAVNLFGGYRNLYGITHAPEVVATRVNSEVNKLAPFYPTPDIPLFDGYDLEDNPEDSVTYLTQHESGIAQQHHLIEATPTSFVRDIRPKLNGIPTIEGEFNSGKYGSTFPGIYSARTYLKIMSHDCATLLHRVAQPLATLAWLRGADYATEQYEAWDRLLLQNSVHDCICGVSIDQVHEKMEDIYRKVFDGALADSERSLNAILSDFAPGVYAVNVNPFAYSEFVGAVNNHPHTGNLKGIGVWPLKPIQFANGESPELLEKRETAACSVKAGDAYHFEIDESGDIRLNGRPVSFVLRREAGDTYSDETNEVIGKLHIDGPLKWAQSHMDRRVCFTCVATVGDIDVRADVTVSMPDDDRLLLWTIDLDSTGGNFTLDLVYESGLVGDVYAGMPFDVVQRESADTDLLPRIPDPSIANILLGQREINRVNTFPFQEYVALSDGRETVALFAKGLQSYRVTPDGKLSLMLRRSVEWLTAGNLENRLGDAGPFFYVPDARCERRVRHEIAFGFGAIDPTKMELQRLNAQFQTPPLIVEVMGYGSHTEWAWRQPNLPMSGLRVLDNEIELRLFNPTVDTAEGVASKQIMSRRVSAETLPTTGNAEISVHNLPTWRVGSNQGMPQAKMMARLDELIAEAEAGMNSAETALQAATGDDRHRFQHKVYIHHRELLEYRLSKRLNELKLALDGTVTDAYLYEPDPLVAEIGYQLNQLRIKRRIYDYVVAAL